ncbi:MAG: hypothetical protein NXI01_05680 [Gammaproteobacteria bacterium]|nr:hypothetical protein [Gammaproteobacteria bacterium]
MEKTTWFESLFITSPSLSYMAICCLTLVLSSAIISSLLLPITGVAQRKNRSAIFFFLFSMQIFMPILGIPLVIAILLLLKYHQSIVYPMDIVTFLTPTYIRKTPIHTQAYAEGWASVRLSLKNFSETERKQALISINRGSKRDINRLYRQLVSDEMEELRICAFSLLENQRNYLHEKINEVVKIHKETRQVNIKAFYAKQLALLYWEFVYLSLGEKEFIKIILEKSKAYADKALKTMKNDPDLLLLLARISLENQDEPTGLKLLKKAVKHHASGSKVYPYLAEKSYKNRDFKQVQTYLLKDDSFEYVLKLHPIVSFWKNIKFR